MSVELKMPKAGLTNTEGTVTEWIARERAHIQKGEVILRVENEKSSFDFESPAEGILLRLAGEGEEVKVGAPMGLLAGSEEEYERLKNAPAPKAVSAAPAIAEERAEAPAEKSAPTPARAATENGRIHISPYAKKLAQNRGIDPARVRGTGPAGRIVARDIENCADAIPAACIGPARDTASLLLDLSGILRLTGALNQAGAGLTAADLLALAAVRAAVSVYGESCANLTLKYLDGGALRAASVPGAGGLTPRALCEALRNAKNGTPAGDMAEGLELYDLSGEMADGFLPGGGSAPLTVSLGRAAERALVLDGKIEIRKCLAVSAAGNGAASLLRLLSALERFAKFPESILY